MHGIISRVRLAAVLATSAAAIAPTTARADDTPACPSSTADAYSMTAGALTGSLGYLVDPVDVTVAAGQSAVVTFTPLTLGDPVPTKLKIDVNGALPVEYDSANGARTATVDVTKNELPTPAHVLFPSLLGY